MKFVQATLITAYLTLATAGAQAQSSATIVCGGVGIDESTRMLGEQRNHSLTWLMTEKNGDYIFGVQTRVLGADGVERTANQDCGPIAQVDVTQPGRYRVTATYNGVTKEQTLNLAPASGQRVHMQW